MKNHLLVVFVLIFSTSLNLPSLGQPLDSTRGERAKANNRRASGLVAYPRIGRNSDVNFGRANRIWSAGLVHYPRVGRSGPPVSHINFNDVVPDKDFQFYNPRDADLNIADQDYEGFTGRSMTPKNTEKTLKDPSWLFLDRLQAPKEYRASQKIDDSRPFYSSSRGPKINDYTPRLGREIDIERPFCK
ncbi:CAPA peptides isoform X2 [Calliopsis andreniformis]|uniref:CAPA peptides isoform X2 n=1 Tax=Calliopsis andreniformis TaxID=337506 RepID=UPI003FCD437B